MLFYSSKYTHSIHIKIEYFNDSLSFAFLVIILMATYLN